MRVKSGTKNTIFFGSKDHSMTGKRGLRKYYWTNSWMKSHSSLSRVFSRCIFLSWKKSKKSPRNYSRSTMVH